MFSRNSSKQQLPKLPNLPTILSSFGCATWRQLHDGATDGEKETIVVFVVGGRLEFDSGCRSMYSIQLGSPKTPPKWKPLPSIPSIRYACQAVVLKDRLYVIGGRDKTKIPVASVQCFDIKQSRWLPSGTVPPMTTARCDFAAVVIAGADILVTGGDDGTSTGLLTCEKYSSRDNTWTKLHLTLLKPRLQHTATVISDDNHAQTHSSSKILVVGGRSDASCELLHLNDNKVIQLPSMSQPRASPVLIQHRQHYLVVGGIKDPREKNKEFLNSIECLDPTFQKWQLMTNIPLQRPRAFAGCCSVDSNMFVMGGCHKSFQATNTCEHIDMKALLLEFVESQAPLSKYLSDHGRSSSFKSNASQDTDLRITGSDQSVSRIPASTSNLPNLPHILSSCGCTTYSKGENVDASTIFVVGGRISKEVKSNQLYSIRPFSRRSKKWKAVSELPAPRYACQAVVSNHMLYVIGGRDSKRQALASVECFNIQQKRWHKNMASMKTPRFDFAAVVLKGGEILVIGGGGRSSKKLSSCELYSPERNTWTTLSLTLQKRRVQHEATLVDRTSPCAMVLVVGGYGETSCELLDLSEKKSTLLPPMVCKRASPTLVWHRNYLLVAGGLSKDKSTGKYTNYLESVECFDQNLNKWRIVPQSQQRQPRAFAGGCSIGSTLFLIGGCGETFQGMATCDQINLDELIIASSIECTGEIKNKFLSNSKGWRRYGLQENPEAQSTRSINIPGRQMSNANLTDTATSQHQIDGKGCTNTNDPVQSAPIHDSTIEQQKSESLKDAVRKISSRLTENDTAITTVKQLKTNETSVGLELITRFPREIQELLTSALAANEDKDELAYILSNAEYREFYLSMQQRMGQLIRAMDILSSGIVHRSAGFRAGIIKIIREGKVKSAFEEILRPRMTGKVLSEVMNLMTFHTAGSLGTLLNAIITSGEDRTEHMQATTISKFVALADACHRDAGGLDGVLERTTRHVLRGLIESKKMPEKNKMSPFKHRLYKLLGSQVAISTPIEEMGYSFAEKAVFLIGDCSSTKDESSELSDILMGRCEYSGLNARLEEVLASSLLGVQISAVKEMSRLQIEGEAHQRSTPFTVPNSPSMKQLDEKLNNVETEMKRFAQILQQISGQPGSKSPYAVLANAGGGLVQACIDSHQEEKRSQQDTDFLSLLADCFDQIQLLTEQLVVAEEKIEKLENQK